MRIRKSSIVIAIAGLCMAIFSAPVARAETFVFSSGPLTNLNPATATINGGFTKFPAGKGLYIQQCNEPVGTARPTICSGTIQVWVSDTARGAAKSTDPVTIKPTTTITGPAGTVDCTKVTCGLFFQVDRFSPADDTSEDKFMPITFAEGTAGPSLVPDVFTVTANGAPLVRNIPSNLAYRSEVTIVATALSGLPTEITSLNANCVVRDGKISALKGSGECALSVKAAGNTTVAPTSAIYPFILGLGEQSIKAFPLTLKVKAKRSLPAQSSFGQNIKYVTESKNCRITRNTVLGVRKGSCRITASAASQDGLWKAFVRNYTIKIG
jgi:hypothetical protein